MGVWVVVGVIFGAILWYTDVAGAVAGGVVAWLLWQMKSLQLQVKELSQKLSIQENVTEEKSSQLHEKPLLKQKVHVQKVAQEKTADEPQIEIELPEQYQYVPKRTQQTAAHSDKDAVSQYWENNAWRKGLSEKIEYVLTWFTSGNMLVRIGSVVLFFGAGFLLKYAAEHSQLSIEVRMIGVAVLACVMLGVGWYLRASRMLYALSLQGGGLGLLYLTIFASFRLYHLLPASVALILLALVSGAGVALAVIYDARWLAILSFAGGFLAPILASTGTGSHVALFSWYAVLNIGIAVLAWFKAWRSLNLLGMTATFVIVALWGNQYYREAYFDSVEPFLIGFGLMYLAIGVLFSLHKADPEQEDFGRVDASIVFGTPVGFFLLQTPLVHHFEHGMSLSALVAGLVYMTAAWLAYKYQNKTLMTALISIGVALLTLAIPLEFDEAETAAAWAMEGVGLLWLGLKQQSSRALVTGMALQVLAVGSWLWGSPIGVMPTYGATLSAFLIAISSWVCAYMLGKHQTWQTEHSMVKAVLAFDVGFALQLWGLMAWLVAGLHELDHHFNHYNEILSSLAWIFVSAWVVEWLGVRLGWFKLRSLNQGLILVCWAGFFVQGMHAAHPSKGLGWLLWLFALPTTVWMLYVSDKVGISVKKYRTNIFHVGLACFVAALLTWEIHWHVEQWFALTTGYGLWVGLVLGLVVSLLLIFISVDAERWPMAAHKHSYLKVSALLYVLVLSFWFIWETKQAVQSGMAYIPLFNPLDVVVVIMGMAWFRWFKALQEHEMLWLDKRVFYAAAGIAMFIWFNTDIARIAHHYLHVPWTERAMLHAVEFQAALSISWSILALLLMFMAGRHHMRYLWMVGAVLLGMVMLKLFTIDMSGSGTLARIVSFLGVGGLFLVIGYFSPLPPVEKEKDSN